MVYILSVCLSVCLSDYQRDNSKLWKFSNFVAGEPLAQESHSD